MSGEPKGKIIVVGPTDGSLKISDVTEEIISGIMDLGAVDVVGVGDAMFLACSAINLSCEIAKIYVNQLGFGNFEDPHLGKTEAIFAHLAQQESVDYEKLVAEEEKAMDNIGDRTVSVGHEIPIEKLVTRSLMALARFDEIKLIAAGGSINEAVSLALRLTNGQISKDPVGVKLIYVYSINMRNDPAKRISAISIYLQKGIIIEPSAFIKELKTELSA
jgi:DNA-binding protein